MYFPILRGRQFELLALRECVNKSLLSNKIIPIVEHTQKPWILS